MPIHRFQPDNKLAKGGKREGAGRKSAKELKEITRAANNARRRLEDSLAQIEETYVYMAVDGQHERSTLHAMENYVKPVSHDIQPISINYQFVQFSSNQNPSQLSAEGVSAPVLVGDGRGQEEGGEMLASPLGKRYDGLEFHHFTNVRGK